MKVTLKAARVNANYTQEKAAKALDVSRDTIRNWENGKSFPSIKQVEKILNLYCVKLDDIIFLNKNYT